jgi:hypothetical protein
MAEVFPSVARGELFEQSDREAVRGGGSRLVPMVPVGEGKTLPCIWKSHHPKPCDINQDGHPLPAFECLLLISRDPLQTIRAEIDVRAWAQFSSGPVEW